MDFQMFKAPKALPLLLALALAPAAWAQTSSGQQAPAPAQTAPDMGTAAGDQTNAGGIGTPYSAGTSGDWEERCVHAENGKDPCQLYQLLKDDKGNAVAEFGIQPLAAGGQAVAGANIVTPLETLLPRGVMLQIDSQPARAYGFLFCTGQGCVAKIGFTADELAQMRKGQKITIEVVPVAAPDQPVALSISLKGFSAGYDQVGKLNAQHGSTPPSGGSLLPPQQAEKPKVQGLSGN